MQKQQLQKPKLTPRERMEVLGLTGASLFIYMDKDHKCVRKITPHPDFFDGDWDALVRALTHSSRRKKNYFRYEIE